MISRYAGKIAEDESNDDEYVALRIFLWPWRIKASFL
jgi:hypothetical protein